MAPVIDATFLRVERSKVSSSEPGWPGLPIAIGYTLIPSVADNFAASSGVRPGTLWTPSVKSTTTLLLASLSESLFAEAAIAVPIAVPPSMILSKRLKWIW